MESITVGQIAAAIALLAALIAGSIKIKDAVKKWLENLLKDKFDSLEKKNSERFDTLEASFKELKNQNNVIDLENCKNYLVTYISEVKRGEVKDEIERERFWEEYAHYTGKGGNSYIKQNVEMLRSSGKI